MDSSGSILIADDDDTFRVSTGRLLQQAGFDCRGVKDTDEAIEELSRRRYDLLVTDIRMPRNPKLRVVREAQKLDDQMPVVLVTGYPSLETAVQSVGLPVAAYLTKPLDFDDLLKHVRAAVKQSQLRRTMMAVAERLQLVLKDIEATPQRATGRTDGGTEPLSRVTIRTLAACLSQLLDLAARSGADWASQNLCELIDCPQLPIHRRAILEAIEALKKTKDTFKSKALAQLRANLEAVM